MKIYIPLLCLVLASPVFACNLQNKDVKAFVANADLCNHFAREWDSELSKADQKRIEQSIDKYCGNAKQQMHGLQKKYKGDAEIEQLINTDSVQTYTK